MPVNLPSSTSAAPLKGEREVGTTRGLLHTTQSESFYIILPHIRVNMYVKDIMDVYSKDYLFHVVMSFFQKSPFS